MKVRYRIVRIFQPKCHGVEEAYYYGAKKKGLFGWKYLQKYGDKHSFSYGAYGLFATKREVQLYLLTIFGRRNEREV